MVNLFKEHLEKGVDWMLGTKKTTKEDDLAALKEHQNSDAAFLGFIKKSQQRTSEFLSKGFHEIDMPTLSTAMTDSEEQQKIQMSVPTGYSAMQPHISESLQDKKRRLFKWNNYEKI